MKLFSKAAMITPAAYNKSFQVEVTAEYSAYDLSNFIGDFGGYLGLLLGGSLPALIGKPNVQFKISILLWSF